MIQGIPLLTKNIFLYLKSNSSFKKDRNFSKRIIKNVPFKVLVTYSVDEEKDYLTR
jgi:hypothetical protein